MNTQEMGDFLKGKLWDKNHWISPDGKTVEYHEIEIEEFLKTAQYYSDTVVRVAIQRWPRNTTLTVTHMFGDEGYDPAHPDVVTRIYRIIKMHHIDFDNLPVWQVESRIVEFLRPSLEDYEDMIPPDLHQW